MRASDTLLRTTLLPNTAVRELRNVAVKTLVPLQHLISENLSGLGISYRQTDRRAQLLKFLPGQHALQAGDRVPDLELKPGVLNDGIRTSVCFYDLLRQALYALFIEVSPEYYERDQQRIVSLLNPLMERLRWIKPYRKMIRTRGKQQTYVGMQRSGFVKKYTRLYLVSDK